MKWVLMIPDSDIQPRDSSLTDQRVGGQVEPGAAVLLRDREAEQAQLPEPATISRGTRLALELGGDAG